MINSLRGMNDILDNDSIRFEYFISNSSKIAKKFGFTFIQTPHLEESALFKRSVGESSDIVGKEMYQFIDKGNNDVCLRPEGTAGVVRAFIQKKLDRSKGVNKFFYYGSMFRYERPQKGRLRSFNQFGCESFGLSNMYEDANMIMLIKEILDFFKITFVIKLNSLGCKECMPKYKSSLVEYLSKFKTTLCDDCQRRVVTNPIRVLDCKNSNCQSLFGNSPKITYSLCDECNSDFEKLKSILDNNGVIYEIDPNLVRGLDYYSKTAFEFISSNIGSQNAIAGGGRYDRLVEFLDGRATPAIGFAIGVERLLELIDMPDIKRDGYYFGAMDEDAIDLINSLGNRKRAQDRVVIEYEAKKLKAHLKNADRANVQYCVIIGEEELLKNSVWVKNLDSKEEKLINIEQL